MKQCPAAKTPYNHKWLVHEWSRGGSDTYNIAEKFGFKEGGIHMKFNKAGFLGALFIFFSFIISIYFIFYTDALIPAGYDLAIDGIVISRTLMIALTLYLASKLGYFLLNKKD
ncbi:MULTISPECIES: hypothetical protein [Bacillus]